METENHQQTEQKVLFENLIEKLMNDQLGSQPDFFSNRLISQLRNNLIQHLKKGNMHPAGVGKHFSFQRNTDIRGDVIHWIDNDSKDQAEMEFLAIMQEFIQYLNETCYTNINDFEFHYAYYDVGSFYKRHLDQFHKDSGRKFSFVTYLNEDWKPTDKGQLIAYAPEKKITLLPKARTVAFFKADEVEHEVLPANRPRMSIAGWLKRS